MAHPLLPGVRSVTGHSVGGHGALIRAVKNPRQLPFRVSVTAYLSSNAVWLGAGLLPDLSR